MENHIERKNDNKPFFVLYGGGPFAIGYEAGVLDELKDRGVDISDADFLGTSAGSWVSGFQAAGVEFDDVANMEQIKMFNFKPDYLRGYAREVFGDKRADNINATAVRFPTFRNRKFNLQVMNGGDYDLADIVSASSSVPGVFSPARVEGGVYWDGGAGGSVGYAHIAPEADTLVAVSALAQHLQPPVGPLGRMVGPALEFKTKRELATWQHKFGGEVLHIRPNREINSMVKSPKDIFDFEIAKDVYWMAREQASELIRTREGIAKLALRLAA